MFGGRPFAFSVGSAIIALAIISFIVFWASNECRYRMTIDMLQREGCILDYGESSETFQFNRLWSRPVRGVTISSDGRTNQSPERDEDLSLFRALATIRTLESIQFHQKPRPTFPNGLHFASLKFLGFHNTVVDDRTFPSEFSAENLEHLEFSYTNVSDNELANLQFPNLSRLVVRGSGSRVTGDFLKLMTCKSSLSELEIVGSNFRLENFQYLDEFPNLRTLSIQFETVGFSQFPDLPKLLSLTLYVDHLDERLIDGLSHLEALSTLTIYPDRISPELNEEVHSNRCLELRGRKLIEECFESFKNTP